MKPKQVIYNPNLTTKKRRRSI